MKFSSSVALSILAAALAVQGNPIANAAAAADEVSVPEVSTSESIGIASKPVEKGHGCPDHLSCGKWCVKEKFYRFCETKKQTQVTHGGYCVLFTCHCTWPKCT